MQKEQIAEAIIFASPEPVSSDKLLKFLEIDIEELFRIITHLNQKYKDTGSSFSIREVAGGYQFFVKKEYATLLRSFFSFEPRRLSKASLEVLAIIAIRQPVTRRIIDAIRKAGSDWVIRNLLELGLIKIVGRAKGSRAFLYGTTEDFLSIFGLRNIDELPRPEELTQQLYQDLISEIKGETKGVNNVEKE